MASVYKAGAQVIFECKEALRKLNALDQVAAKAESYTIKDLKTRVPGLISTATAKIYNLNKKEVAAAHRTKAYLSKKKFSEANRAHMRTSFKGDTLDSLTVIFTGRKHANWDTKATPMPEPVSSRTFSVKQKYAVSQTVYKNKPVVIKPKKKYRVFVLARNGKLLPMIVGSGGRGKPRLKASTSVPQAVMNQDVVRIWRPKLNEYTLKRFNNHLKRFSEKI